MSQPDFAVVTTGGSYNHNHRSRGQNSVTLVGIECPQCKHIFNPGPWHSPIDCPVCGYSDDGTPKDQTP